MSTPGPVAVSAMGADEADSLVATVHHKLVAESDRDPSSREEIVCLLRDAAPLLATADLDALVDRVVDRVEGLGLLQPLLTDETVTDVMVNGPGPVWVERGGTLVETDVVVTGPEVSHLIERVVGPLGLRIDRERPFVDARLPGGERAHAVLPPVAVDGPYLTIRRFAARPFPLTAMAEPAVADLLSRCVAERRNIVVSGATGAGKTTLLNALAATLGPDERVVTIEDAAELRLAGDQVVRLEARVANVEGRGEVTIRELVRNALRMRPDRIVVGEVRGPEAFDLLQALNTGHDGSLSTCHANSADDGVRRLRSMVLMARTGLSETAVDEQLRSGIDLLVHIARSSTGRRQVVEVAELPPPAAPASESPRRIVVAGAPVAEPRRLPRRVRSAAAAGLADGDGEPWAP